MKKEKFFLVGMLAIALVFGLTVSGCDNGGGFDEDLPSIEDLGLTGYHPMTADRARESDVTSTVTGTTSHTDVLSTALGSMSYNIQGLSSRAAQRINYRDSSTGITVTGTCNVTSNNATFDFTITFPGDRIDGTYIKGTMTGSGSMNMSTGSFTYDFNWALIYAFESEREYVRSVAKVSMSMDADMKISMNYWLYGDGTTLLDKASFTYP